MCTWAVVCIESGALVLSLELGSNGLGCLGLGLVHGINALLCGRDAVEVLLVCCEWVGRGKGALIRV